MAVYEVVGPDGKKFRVKAKEGQTQQDANRYILGKYYGDKPADVTQISNLASVVPEMPAEKPAQERSYIPGPSVVDKALQPVTSYPEALRRAAGESYEFAQEGVKQLQEPGVMPKVKGAGKIGLGLLGVATAPAEAAIETVVGKPIEEAAGIPSEATELVAAGLLPFGSKTKAVRQAAKQVEEKTGVDLLEATIAGQAEKSAREQVIKSTQTPLPIEQVKGGIAAKPIQVYQDYVGRPAFEFMKQNPLATATGAFGSVMGTEMLPEDASIEDKMMAAALGGLGGFGLAKGSKYLAGKVPAGNNENLANWFSRMTIDNYGLPADYLSVKQNAKIFRNEMTSDFLDLTRDVAKLSDDERRTMYYMMQGEALPAKDLANLSEKARDTITKYGQKMVDVGLLSPETFEKNAATYLRREYASNLNPEGLISRAANNLRVIGSSLKPRGVIMDISPKKLAQYEADGWEKFGESKGGKIRVRRQLTPEERQAKGEIDDAAYAIARTGQLMSNDIATYKMYDDIAKMDQYVSNQPVEGWVQMSSDKIPKTNVARYGNLAGKYVAPEVAQDLQSLDFAKKLSRNPLIKTYREALTAWKTTKTALNPVVHMNNIASNVMIYDLSGSDWRSLGRAANELRKGKDSDLFKQAEKLGVFDSGFASQELGREGRQVLDAIEKSRPSDNPVDSILKIANAGWEKTGGKVIDAYQGEDSIFRFGIFVDRINAGMSPEDAAKEAKKWLIDYEINAPLIQAMRNTTHPFIAYSYRAIPLLAESAALRPWKFAKWAGIGHALNEYGESESPGRDIEAERRMMPERQQGTMFGIPGSSPTMLKLPSKEPTPDAEGNVPPSMYLDVQRFIPGGDVFATSEAGSRRIELLPQFLQPGGPIMDFITIFQEGRDPFTGQDLPGLNIGKTKGEVLLNNSSIKAAKFLTSFLPNLPGIPGAAATEKFKKAEAGAEGLTQPPLTVTQAALQSFGIKVTPIDVDKLTMQQMFAMDREINTVAKDYQSKLRRHEQGLMDDDELTKHSDTFQNRLEGIFSKYEKRIQGPQKEEAAVQEVPQSQPTAEPQRIRFVGPDGRPYNVKIKPGQTEADVEKYIMDKYYGGSSESTPTAPARAHGGVIRKANGGTALVDRQKVISEIRQTPWFREFVKEYGEEPDLSENADYDYVTAWTSGIRPERDPYDKNRYHWSSMTPNGVILKKPGHPTMWKTLFMEQTGKNPDAIGIKNEQEAQAYINAQRIKKARGGYTLQEELLLKQYANR